MACDRYPCPECGRWNGRVDEWPNVFRCEQCGILYGVNLSDDGEDDQMIQDMSLRITGWDVEPEIEEPGTISE